MHETILIVDMAPFAQGQEKKQALRDILQYQVTTVSRMQEAIDWLRAGKAPIPDVVLFDIVTGHEKETLAGIAAIKKLKPDLSMLALVDYGSEGYGVEAVKSGAFDFLCKPVSLEHLRVTLQNALRLQRMNQYVTWLERKAAGHVDMEDVIGESPQIEEARALARQAAASRMPVWIEGDPGTGKTALARAIHGSSDCAGKSFVTVNCEMLPEHMAPGVLFGQEQAESSNEIHFILGKIREADQGTLLLQEAGALPLELQQQLIDMLQLGAVKPLGGQIASPVNVRLICTTAKRDRYYVQQSAFRQKMSQHFQLLSIVLPPLNGRAGDIRLLAQHFLLIHATSENKYISGLTDRALEWLEQRQWQGNIGQLANMIWRAVMLCESNILDVEDLKAVQKSRSLYLADYPQHAIGGPVLLDEKGHVKTLKSVQQEAIRFALEQANGCMTRAARNLGIGRSTLYRKVSEFSMNDHISRANQTTRPMINVSSADRS